MARFPAIVGNGRGRLLADIIALGLMQATGLGMVAFATRNAFADLHAGFAPSFDTLGLLATGGVSAACLTAWGRVISERLGQDYAVAVRRQLYGHVAGMNASDVARMRLGTLAIRFVGDLSAIRNWAGLGVGRLVVACCTIPAAMTILWLIQPMLALAALGPLLVMSALAIIAGMGLGNRHRALRRQRWHLASNVVERLKAAPELDMLGRTGQELAWLDRAGRRLSANAVRRRLTSEILRCLPHIGAALGGCLVLYMTARLGLPASDAAAGLSVLALVAAPCVELTGLWDRFCAWRLAHAAGRRLLARPSTPRPKSDPSGAVGIAIRDSGGELLLVAEPGEIVDTTLSDEALRQIAGQDRGDGLDIHFSNGAAAPRIAYVSPQSILLRGSLRRNLTLGARPRPEVALVRRVAKANGLAPLLTRLGSTRARVSEGAGELSRREQLGVLLTRASLMRPQLIVIDHPEMGDDESRLLGHLHEMTGATILVNRPTQGNNRDLIELAAR